MTATTEVVISEKSKLEFRMSDLSGTAHSRIVDNTHLGILFFGSLRPEPIGSSRVNILNRTASSPPEQ